VGIAKALPMGKELAAIGKGDSFALYCFRGVCYYSSAETLEAT
jgi:hypothetical protein